MSEVSKEQIPAHMRYEFIGELARQEPNPALLARYLAALVNDDEAFASAVGSMTRVPVGFNTLYVSKDPNLQINFYREDVTGNQDPHGHARVARTNFYAPPGTIQTIVRHRVLPRGARRVSGLPVQELRLMPNNVIEASSGGRPIYGLTGLGPVLVLVDSLTRKATLSGECFWPWEVHHAHMSEMRGRVAMSTHVKFQEEPAELSEPEGLVAYKGMSPDDAHLLADIRSELEADIAAGKIPGASRLGPATMIYVPLDRRPEDMEPLPTITPPVLAEELILGGLRTAKELSR